MEDMLELVIIGIMKVKDLRALKKNKLNWWGLDLVKLNILMKVRRIFMMLPVFVRVV